MKTRAITSVLVLIFVSFSFSAFAQEDATAEDQREPASAAPQRPQETSQQAPQQAPQHHRHLSEEDQRILDRGPIPQGRYIGGGVTGSIVGFGVGHAIQGRYRDNGWIFTAGEGGAVGVMLVGVMQCFGDSRYDDYRSACDRGGVIAGAGLIALIGFHIWEVIDLWVAPSKINRRYEELTRSQQPPRVSFRMAPIMVSQTTPGLGLSLEF